MQVLIYSVEPFLNTNELEDTWLHYKIVYQICNVQAVLLVLYYDRFWGTLILTYTCLKIYLEYPFLPSATLCCGGNLGDIALVIATSNGKIASAKWATLSDNELLSFFELISEQGLISPHPQKCEQFIKICMLDSHRYVLTTQSRTSCKEGMLCGAKKYSLMLIEFDDSTGGFTNFQFH